MRNFKFAIVALAMLTIPAVAQDNNQAKEFDIKVTGADITLVGEALGMMPYGKVAPLMQKLQNQINKQIDLTLTPPPKADVPEAKK